eukprot:353535-Chlamydomonas_euryale.AAC.2
MAHASASSGGPTAAALNASALGDCASPVPRQAAMRSGSCSEDSTHECTMWRITTTVSVAFVHVANAPMTCESVGHAARAVAPVSAHVSWTSSTTCASRGN